MSVNRPTVEAVLAFIEKLPEPPGACVKALSLMDNPNVALSKLAQFIGMDEILTTKLLRHANSSEHGYNSKVHTVMAAMARLGTNTTRSTLYGYLLQQQKYKPTPLFVDLWQSSLYTGLMASHIAAKFNIERVDLCFTSGLLCDVGQLVLNEFDTHFYAVLLNEAKNRGIQVHEMEKQVLGFDHCRIGKDVCFKWQLPNLYNNVIRYHHEPLKAQANLLKDDFAIVVAVHVANSINPWLTEGSFDTVDMAAVKAVKGTVTKELLEVTVKQKNDTIISEVKALTQLMFEAQVST